MRSNWSVAKRHMAFISRRIPDFNLGDFARGLALPFRGAGFLFRNRGLKRYAVLPLVLNILIYAVVLAVFFHFLWNWRVGTVEWRFWGPIGGWLAAAVGWLGWFLRLVAAMLALGAAFFTFTGVGMVLASPLNDILSERAELVWSGREGRLSMPLRFTAKAAFISACDSLMNLLRQLFFTLLALPFLLVPMVGFAPLFLVGGYFAAFGFIDSAMARNFLRPRHKKLLTAKRFWELLGFGTAMQACFAVPFLGMLLMPVGVVAGTLVYCGEDWESLLAGAGIPAPNGFQPPKKAETPVPRLVSLPDKAKGSL